MIIREIQKLDNPKLEQIIKAIFPEFGLPIVGTAYEDEETPKMFESYQGKREIYFVIESNGVVFGGGGIKPLRGHENDVCELQKIYFDIERVIPHIFSEIIGENILNFDIQHYTQLERYLIYFVPTIAPLVSFLFPE